jgi:hypothetical protein
VSERNEEVNADASDETGLLKPQGAESNDIDFKILFDNPPFCNRQRMRASLESQRSGALVARQNVSLIVRIFAARGRGRR